MMRFKNKISVVIIICLLSFNTYSQLYQYSKEGEQLSVDYDGKSTENPITGIGISCFCYFLGDLHNFNRAIGAQSNRDLWLASQENLLRIEIANRSGFPPNTFPTFLDAFKFSVQYESSNVAKSYRPRIWNRFITNNDFSDIEYRKTGYEKVSLEFVRENMQSLPHYQLFGDLKYKRHLLKDIKPENMDWLNNEIGELNVRHNEEASKLIGVRTFEKQLEKAQSNGIFKDYLIDRYVIFYNNLNYEDAVRYATQRMVADYSGNTPNDNSFGPNFSVADFDYIDTFVPMTHAVDVPQQPLERLDDTPSDDALLYFAAYNHLGGHEVFRYLRKYPDIKNMLKRFFTEKEYVYNGYALAAAQRFLGSYASGNQTYSPTFFSFKSSRDLTAFTNFQNSENINRAFNVLVNSTKPTEFYWGGFHNVLHLMFNQDSVNRDFEGAVYRDVFSDNFLSIHENITNEQLANTFDVKPDSNPYFRTAPSIELQFENNMGVHFFNRDLDIIELLKNPNFIDIVGNLSQSPSLSLEKIKLFSVSDKLKLSTLEKDWLIANKPSLDALDQYLMDSSNSVESIAFAREAFNALRNNGTVDFEDEIIIDNSVSNCMRNIINELRLKDNFGSINPDVSDPGANHIAQIILDMFDTDPTYDISFSQIQLGNNSDGNELNGRTRVNGNIFNIEIDSDLVNDGTQLFIAKTIIHESMHAYLSYNSFFNNQDGVYLVLAIQRLHRKYIEDNPGSSDQLSQHDFMGQYVEALARSLAVWDFNKQPLEYYKKLSWGGLETSSAYQALPESEKREIQNIIKNEREAKSGAKGDKCP